MAGLELSRRRAGEADGGRRLSRFAQPQDPVFRELNTSLGFDRRLWPHDVRQSRAHARMLAGAGIISGADRDALLRRSTRSRRSWRRGASRSCPTTRTSTWRSSGGSPSSPGRRGGRLHTARSRNDQVATDVALFTRDARADARPGIEALAAALADVAERHLDWALPGYTHLQRAQPVYLAHHLLAYVWMLVRDRARMRFVARPPRCCRSARARSRASTSTPTAAPSRRSSASPAWRRTRSTRSPTATSSWTTSARPRRARCTSPASAPRSCCGRARSSASAS